MYGRRFVCDRYQESPTSNQTWSNSPMAQPRIYGLRFAASGPRIPLIHCEAVFKLTVPNHGLEAGQENASFAAANATGMKSSEYLAGWFSAYLTKMAMS